MHGTYLELPLVLKAAMSVPATFSFDAPGDAVRAVELRRVKALATLVLAGTLALFVAAKALLNVHPISASSLRLPKQQQSAGSPTGTP